VPLRPLLTGVLGAWSLAAPATSAAPVDLEYRVKAAFVYNFVKFVDWPPRAFGGEDGPIVICVLGQDPFGDLLVQTVRDKTIHGRKLVVVRSSQIEAAKVSHVLFISASEDQRLEAILEGVGDAPVLTVGDDRNFARRGGAIRLMKEDQRVRFEVNLEATERAGLRISSKLLSLARTILPSRRISGAGVP
jgi:uncharacterized protein DUF4154